MEWRFLQCFDKISHFFSTQTLRYDIIVNDFMIKKGSVHSVGCYWRCHLPQNKCHCLPITQSCRFLLPVNEHSPHVKSPATTYYYNVHCAAAAGGESPPRTFTFVTTDLSCKIFFEKKNNTDVITKLNRQKPWKILYYL